MDSQQVNTKRIAKNTMLLYVRMFFAMIVSLYTSRAILDALGVEDYGIYEVVGGFVGFFSLISSSLSSAVSRFITFELGKTKGQDLKGVFSVSLYLHIVLVFVVFIVAETVGLWYLNRYLVLPTDRLPAAHWVFQASVVTFTASLLTVPYTATIVAYERLNVFAYSGILLVILKLGVVLLLVFTHQPIDKLIFYAWMLALLTVGFQVFYICYCRKQFEACRGITLSYNKAYWIQICSFAGWNFIGCMAGIMRNQGVSLLLNSAFGVIVNSARGIASTVNGACTSFSGTFMTALNPQITKSYSSGDMNYVFSLVERGARFSFYLLMIVIIPVLFETEFILNFWLGKQIPHMIELVRLTLIISLVDILSNPLITLQLATGRIRNYQLFVGGTLLMEFPLVFLCLKIGGTPEMAYFVSLFISIGCLSLRLFFLRKMTGLSVWHFVHAVCLKALSVASLSVVFPIIMIHICPDGWFRFVIVVLSSLLNSCIVVYYWGCSSSERQFILHEITKLKTRFVK